MADLLTTLTNLDSNSPKSDAMKEVKAEIDNLIKLVDDEIALSKKLYTGGKTEEANELLDLVGRHLDILKRLLNAVSEVSKKVN